MTHIGVFAGLDERVVACIDGVEVVVGVGRNFDCPIEHISKDSEFVFGGVESGYT